MSDDVHDRLAVLFAIKSAHTLVKPVQPVTSEMLFAHLPMALRTRWTKDHLTRVVLRGLIYDGLVEVRQVGPSLVRYALTKQGSEKLTEQVP